MGLEIAFWVLAVIVVAAALAVVVLPNIFRSALSLALRRRGITTSSHTMRLMVCSRCGVRSPCRQLVSHTQRYAVTPFPVHSRRPGFLCQALDAEKLQ